MNKSREPKEHHRFPRSRDGIGSVQTYEEKEDEVSVCTSDGSSEEEGGSEDLADNQNETKSQIAFNDKGKNKSPAACNKIESESPVAPKVTKNESAALEITKKIERDKASTSEKKLPIDIQDNKWKIACIAFIVCILAVGIAKFDFSKPAVVKCESATLIRNTKDIMWQSLESGINEVMNFSKPSVFLYVYQDATEEYVDQLLHDASTYALCQLTNNAHTTPIEITSDQLKHYSTDYGHVIENYHKELKNRPVMVVKHLDQVPGQVAQAFHSLCDEYTPLVPKSLFMFSMKVPKYYEPHYELVERILRSHWSDLKQDIFDPLLTRISSMIVRVDPLK